MYMYEVNYSATSGRANQVFNGKLNPSERYVLNLAGLGAERVGLECTNLFLSTNSTLL